MRRRIRQRLAERVARLEEEVARPSRDELLLGFFLRLAEAGVLGDRFADAWERYLRARAEIEARGVVPPADYDRGRAEPERTARWRRWHHRALDKPIEVLLDLADGWVQRHKSGPQPTESDPE